MGLTLDSGAPGCRERQVRDGRWQKGDANLSTISRSIPADRMAVLFAIMLVAAAGTTAMQSIIPALGAKLHLPNGWASMAWSWSALLWVVTDAHWAPQSEQIGRTWEKERV